MAKRSISEQLDEAVEATMTSPDAPPRVGPRLAALLRIAAELRDLPREGFKAHLKADLEQRASGARRATPVPEGYHTATPCLVIRDAPRAIDFYKQAFGATELMRMADPSGNLVHAEIEIGDSRIAIAGEAPEWGNLSPQALGGSPVIMQVYVEDVDVLAERAVAAGATVLIPIADQFYGDRSCRLADPFGHVWIVATHKEDVSPEEMQRRADAWMQQAEASAAQQPEPEAAAVPIPAGVRAITPYLQVDGAAKLIDFLARAFGATEIFRSAEPDGMIKHAEVRIEDSVVELGDATPEHAANPTAIHLYVKDVDATYRRALQAGGTSMDEPSDQEYGERSASVKDPWGNHWYIATVFEKSAGPIEYVPEGLHSVTPYLHPHGAPKLIDFLKQAFGAEEVFRAQSEGIVHHAKIRIGESVIEMGEAHGPYQPMLPAFHVYVDDADAVYQRALRAGAASVQEPTDRPWGHRGAGVKDPFDNLWWIAAPLAVGAAGAAPPGYHVVTPYLRVEEAPKLIDFLARAFGATEVMRAGDPNGHFHGEVRIGDSIIMMGNAGRSYPSETPMPAAIYLYVPDVDATYRRALQAGATSMQVPTDQEYGDRNAFLKDPFGNVWYIATRKPTSTVD